MLSMHCAVYYKGYNKIKEERPYMTLRCLQSRRELPFIIYGFVLCLTRILPFLRYLYQSILLEADTQN